MSGVITPSWRFPISFNKNCQSKSYWPKQFSLKFKQLSWQTNIWTALKKFGKTISSYWNWRNKNFFGDRTISLSKQGKQGDQQVKTTGLNSFFPWTWFEVDTAWLLLVLIKFMDRETNLCLHHFLEVYLRSLVSQNAILTETVSFYPLSAWKIRTDLSLSNNSNQ